MKISKIHLLVTGIGLLLCWVFWWSRLSLFPYPWPDDSAFFLTGVDWFSWPPQYLMKSQAPWVPSYYEANFNTMPALPMLLGLSHLLGWSGSQEIRLFGMIALAIWCWLFSRFILLRLKKDVDIQYRRWMVWVFLFPIIALLCPMIRWGSMVVRPEIWQGLVWLAILTELISRTGSLSEVQLRDRPIPVGWKIPVYLALAAYLHFEGIIWVLPTALALFPFELQDSFRSKLKVWIKSSLEVSWKVLILLGPWLIYVVLNWDLFWDQMDVQFGRANTLINRPTENIYVWFHSLWTHYGNPVQMPKFLNIAKFVFWGWAVLATLRVIYLLFIDSQERAARIAAVAAFLSSLYLWASKPEVWFITLVHLTFWPLVLLSFRMPLWHLRHFMSHPRRRWAMFSGMGAAAVLFLVYLSTTIYQVVEADDRITWRRYHEWVACIAGNLGDHQVIFQPYWPDVLVELRSQDPDLDLTRHVDFPHREQYVAQHLNQVDAVLRTEGFPSWMAFGKLSHRGAPREEDLSYIRTHRWLKIPEEGQIDPPNETWQTHICHEGVFWAAVSTRRRLPVNEELKSTPEKDNAASKNRIQTPSRRGSHNNGSGSEQSDLGGQDS